MSQLEQLNDSNFDALLSQTHISDFSKTCITIIATQSSCQPCNWLVNCSESLICIAFSSRCRLGDHGIWVNISPCRFIHSLFMLLVHRAWSMRLDLRRNGIKHIVSSLFFLREEDGDKTSTTCSAGKLIQHLAYRKAGWYVSVSSSGSHFGSSSWCRHQLRL